MPKITIGEDTIKEKNIWLVWFNGSFRSLSGEELRNWLRNT